MEYDPNKLARSITGNKIGKNIRLSPYNGKSLDWHSRNWLAFPSLLPKWAGSKHPLRTSVSTFMARRLLNKYLKIFSCRDNPWFLIIIFQSKVSMDDTSF